MVADVQASGSSSGAGVPTLLMHSSYTVCTAGGCNLSPLRYYEKRVRWCSLAHQECGCHLTLCRITHI